MKLDSLCKAARISKTRFDLGIRKIFCAGVTICFVAVLAEGQSDLGLIARSDSEVINALSSPRGRVPVVDEIVHRGVRMIPLLLNLKGDQRPAFAALGHHLSATPTRIAINPSDVVPGKTLTMEVAALYLICAIYHNTVEFAESPYLSDLRLPAGKRDALNSPDLVSRAWQAVEKWKQRLDRTTIQQLRSRKDDPLQGSGVHFW
jgi:hypothetical protein